MTARRRGTAPITAARGFELGLGALGALAVVLILVGASGAWRAAVAFAALLLLPGWAILREIRLEDTVARVGLAVVLSAALAALVSLAMAWRAFWYPVPAAVLMLAVSTLVIVLRRPRAEGAS